MSLFLQDKPIQFVHYCLQYEMQYNERIQMNDLDSADMLQEYYMQSLETYIQKKQGFVYIANHPMINVKNLYKVGFTRNINSREKSLNNASIVGEIIICDHFSCASAELAESIIHEKLNTYQSDKEFFVIPYLELEKIILSVIQSINNKLYVI